MILVEIGEQVHNGLSELIETATVILGAYNKTS